MGTILVVAEIQKGAIRDASYELVAAARGIDSPFLSSDSQATSPACPLSRSAGQ